MHLKRLLIGVLWVAVFSATPRQTQVEPWPREVETVSAPKPKDVPDKWRGLIGEYGSESEPIYILERSGSLWVLRGRGRPDRLQEVSADTFRFVDGAKKDHPVAFERDG